MALEQAGGATMDADTPRTSTRLGVILYELLTGLRPFDSKRLQRQASLDEVVRILREEEPPAPSKRLSADAAATENLPQLGRRRRRLATKANAGTGLGRDEVPEKDRAPPLRDGQRPGAEVQRYLADEPVEWASAVGGLSIQEISHAAQGAAAAAIIVLLALIGGFIGTGWGLIQAKEQEGYADIERIKAHQECGRRHRGGSGPGALASNRTRMGRQGVSRMTRCAGPP